MLRAALPAIAAATVAGAPASALAAEDDPLVATVNGHEIRESYVYSQIESLPLGEQVEIRQRIDHFVESIVREEIMFQSMIGTDFEGEPELRDTIKSAVVQALIEHHVENALEVTEQDVQAFYRDNEPMIRGEYIAASLIVIDDYEQCEALRVTLTDDESFAAVSAEISVDASVRERRGDVGLFMPHAGPWGFEEGLFEMEVGDQRTFDLNGYCHLVRVRERVRPPLPPLELVEENIRGMVRRDKERELLQALFARAEATVTVTRPASAPAKK